MTTAVRPQPDPIGPTLRGRLRRARRLARLALWFERLWPALWPALGIAGLTVAAGLFGLPALLPFWLHATLLAVAAVAIMALLWRGLRPVAAPDAAMVDRRLERATGLRHRPLATLLDRPAWADAAAEALWRVHLARARAGLARLRVGSPRPGLAARDPRALRAAVLLLLVAGLAVAGRDAPARLLRLVSPGLGLAAAPPATELQAWITPPAYTGRPPIFLRADTGAVTVPAGSRFTANLTGGSGRPMLLYGGHGAPFDPLVAGSWQASRSLDAGGHLAVIRQGHPLGGWDVTAVADTPPRIAFAEPPGRTPRGNQTRLPWRADDDYGVVALQAELTLRDRPNAPPLVLPIPLAGNAPSQHGVAIRDLTANPWAGLPVIARLVGHDAPGQQGVSDPAPFVLPERHFDNLTARSLIDVRKELSLAPDDRVSAAEALDAIAAMPQAYDDDAGITLNIASIAALLRRDASPQAIDQAQEQLWQLALALEEKAPERTRRALEAARERAQQALDQARRDPADPDKQSALDQRMKELERAIERHLQALAEQARRQGLDLRPDPAMRSMTERDLQQMMRKMEEAAHQGRMEEAQQRMAELQQLLQQLQNARPEQAKRNAQNRQRGQQQMGALADMVQRENGLLGNAQGRDQAAQDAERGQPGDQSPEPQPGRQPGGTKQGPSPGRRPPQRDADARTQRALRRALGELMQQYGDLTGKVPQALGDADQAMQRGAEALGAGHDQQAAAAEQQAIEALSKGGQQMQQQMAMQFGMPQPGQGEQGQGEGSQDGDQPGDAETGNGDDRRADGLDNGAPGRPGEEGGEHRAYRRDPFGRVTGNGTSGSDEASDVHVPEQREKERSQAIQNELRTREGDRTRPVQEREYIDRLLKLD